MRGRGEDKRVPLITSFDLVFKTKSSYRIPIHFIGKFKIHNRILLSPSLDP